MSTARSSTSRSAPGKSSGGRAKPASKSSGSTRSTTPRKSSGTGSETDAIALLTQDHKDVKKLFKQYDKMVDEGAEDGERQALAEQICTMLTVHATIEEEIFYPAARDALEEQDLLDEAEVEHASAKDLIAQIEAGSPSTDDLYDAKVKVLGEYIDHHVKEEEGEMFPKARKSDLDLEALGEELQERKAALLPAEEAEDTTQ